MPVAEQPDSSFEETNAANQADCVPDQTHSVTMLDPTVIPEVRVEPVTFEAVEQDGERMEKAVVPGFAIPESTVISGCIIEEKAPAGCLGAVSITGFEIPPVRIPAVSVPERRFPDGSVQSAANQEAAEVPGVKIPETSTPRVCQVTTLNARTSAVRPSLVLPYTPLKADPGIDVADDGDTTAYVAPARVLFDEDKALLRPEARSALKSIAAALNKRSPDGKITIDGYTDNQGSAESGLTLSEARAEAVARWLTTRGGIRPDRLVAVNGLGETNPAAPNDSEATMARNRRVVISVTRCHPRHRCERSSQSSG